MLDGSRDLRILTFAIGVLPWINGQAIAEESTMSVTASLKFDKTKLLFQESTSFKAGLSNQSGRTISNINPDNYDGGVNLIVTNTTTGDVRKYQDRDPNDLTPAFPINLSDGESMEKSYFLSDFFEFPQPGTYTVQAHYGWNGGIAEALSSPVTIEVMPARPRRLHVATARGSSGPLYMAAWLNNLAPEKGKFDVWLSTIGTTGKPKLTQSTHVEDVDALIEPVVSVPPNEPPYAQWIAWVDGKRLYYSLHRGEEAFAAESETLDEEGYGIIPPLLQSPPSADEAVPGAAVVLHRANLGGTGGRFCVAQISATGKPKVGQASAYDGPAVVWGKTAYLSKGTRHTFTAAPEKAEVVLRRADWSPSKPLGKFEEAARFPGRYVGADLLLTAEDVIVGAMLTESADKVYEFRKWTLATGKFMATETVSIQMPGGAGIDKTVTRVNASGSPFALILSDQKQPVWYFCGPSGEVKPLSGEAEAFELPGDILFRRGDDPVIMFSAARDGRGFRLTRPH
jgi:hypothetical protein